MKLKPAEVKIREALIDMMDEMPLASIRVKDLVDRAGVSRSAFYLYYDSVFAVLQQIEDDYFDGLHLEGMRYVKSRRSEEPAAVIEGNLRYAAQNAKTVRVLLGYYGDGAFKARLAKTVRGQVVKMDPRFAAKDGKAAIMREWFVGANLYVTRYLAAHPTPETCTEVAEIVSLMAQQDFGPLLKKTGYSSPDAER